MLRILNQLVRDNLPALYIEEFKETFCIFDALKAGFAFWLTISILERRLQNLQIHGQLFVYYLIFRISYHSASSLKQKDDTRKKSQAQTKFV